MTGYVCDLTPELKPLTKLVIRTPTTKLIISAEYENGQLLTSKTRPDLAHDQRILPLIDINELKCFDN